MEARLSSWWMPILILREICSPPVWWTIASARWLVLEKPLARVARMSLERTTMAILPWLVPLLGSLILITYVPIISLWLPRLFYR